MQYVGRPGLAETASSSLTSYSRVSQTGIHPVFRSCKTTLILSIKGSFQQLIFTINLASISVSKTLHIWINSNSMNDKLIDNHVIMNQNHLFLNYSSTAFKTILRARLSETVTTQYVILNLS